MPGTSIALLEAQAATGYLVDPIKNLKFSVEDAVKNGLIGTEVYEKLLSAEKAAMGYKDPSSGENLSLFQAIKRGFVMKNHGRHLLEAQLATGGIIDPTKKHRVPEEVAYRRGIFDKEMNKSLLDPTDNVKGFFDPNTKQNMTYGQLLERCLVDCHTGLYLIPVFDNTHDVQKTPHSFIDYQIKKTLDGVKMTATSGKFKGRVVTMWQLLFSDYFTTEFRESLFKEYTSGSLSVEELSSKVDAAIRDLVSTTKVTFEGLRESVTPGQLLESEIIDKDLFKKLQQGEASAKDVVNIDTVKKYLQGTGSIGGLILTDTQEKISIYQAKRKGFLRPGTSLILLEAQAATGFIIDPVKNKKYSVDEALKANIIGPEFYEKLLSAEKSVTGYKDPYTENIISLFQAMSKDLIVKDHGIRLLEAQIATGGIIDPINSHRIPVEVAYKRGYFDKKMNVILSDPSDDTKGFFDPNSNENLTYLQLKDRCITDPSTSLCLLPLYSRKRQLYINDYIKDSFRNLNIYVRHGRFKEQTVSAWVLINSEYFSEWRRREILEQFRLRKLTVEQVTILIEEEIKKWTEICVPALRGQVNFYNLLEYEIIDKDQFEQVLEGKLTTDDVFKMENVQRCLQGSGVLGGVLIEPSNQRISFYEATKKNILQPSTVLPLLEAQAATGNIIDPVSNQRLSVDEALKAEVINPNIYNRLLSAQEAVTGYRDPFSGKKISLFQAMKKGLVEEKHAKQLLEVQLATGGIIDPIHSFHIPSSVAKKLGYINEEMYESLSHPTEDSKSFYDPHTKENVTYSDLLSRSQKDESTGVYLLPLHQDFAEVPAQNIYTDEEVQQAFRITRIEERNTTIWELIHSGYFTEEQRFEILEKYKSKKESMEELITEILQIVKNNEIKKTTHICFQGLRGKVPVVWLLDLGIITKKTFDELVQGIKSVEEVSELDYVKKCLQGTGSITGAFLPSTKEKMSIYQAMKKNLIMPAYGVLLLEAQAATGFIVDPLKNEKLTVDSAVKSGVVGPELHEKLLIAESAVTGYTDPYTGNKISLGEAINKELIPQKEGLPLLQAQLATGGIVDPLYCHYVPLQVAGKMGFIDEEIIKQTDTLKIYFDPNTKEKLNYQQLKERCYTDPETGSLLLPVSENAAFYAEEHFIDVLKSVMVSVNAGRFKGQTVSVWELLNSEYVSIDKLKELLLLYKNSSSEVIQEIIKTVTSIIEETNASSTKIKFKGLRKQVSASDLFQSDVIDKRTLDELNLGKKTIVEVTEMDNSTNTKMNIYEAMLKRILRPGTALVLLEAQAATGFIVDPVKNRKLSVDEALAEGLIGIDVHAKLLSAEQAVTGYTDPYTEGKISLFQAMQKNLIVDCHGIRLLEAQIATGGIIDPVHSHRVPVEVAYKRGYFDEAMNKILSDPSDDTKGFFDPNTHENLTYLQLVERCIQDPETGLYLLQVSDLISRHIRLQVGKFANQTVTIWEILSSHYFTELKKRKLVKQYTEGVLSIEQLISSLLTIIEEYEAKSSILKFQGIRGETMDDLKEGRQTIETISQQENVKRYLKGSGCITGVLVLPNNETISIFEAMKKGILSRDIGLSLLEAQLSAGFLVDPSNNQTFSISKALSAGLISEEEHQQLEIAEKAFSGFTDLESSRKISLFQAIKKGIVSKDQGIPLLDSQLATGGIGYLDEDFYILISDSVNGRKGFVDPNTHERITYKDLLERCVKDPKTGMYMVQVAEKRDDYFYIDDPTKNILQSTAVKMNEGKFKGQDISLWDLLCSSYISEEKRKYLIKKYKSNTSTTIKEIISIILSIIEDQEKSQNDIWFQGLRKQVTAVELFDAGILNKETLDGLQQETKTVVEVAKTDLVRRYLEGTSCIAGILIPSKHDPTKKEKLNIYDAMLRRLLRPGTALILLEAQAATGFVIDCVQNRKLSVDEALLAGLIGHEIYEKLLCAEKGVTGYTNPYTGDKISLFQAMEKNLIVKEHGIRLLEAQIATGGIIDPVHSHRVPVEVAYKRGYFNEEMNQILSDPTDDTKGFFDPNTQQNLTYLQLLQRCTQDTDTGLYVLELKSSRFSLSHIQTTLQAKIIQVTSGEFQGKSVSIWDLLNSKHISKEKREELLRKYESGTLTIENIMTTVIKIMTEEKINVSHVDTTDLSDQDAQLQELLQAEVVEVSVGDFTGQSRSLWELLHSRYFSEDKKIEILQRLKYGTLTIQETITYVIKVITEAESIKTNAYHSEVYNTLQTVKMDVNEGEFKGQTHTLWDLLNSKYFSIEKKQEFLDQFSSGVVSVDKLIKMIITIISETEERSKKLKFKGLRRQVTATELLVSEIIDQNILTDLAQGKKTVEEVTQIDSVKRYLEGTSCMAGVLVPSLKDPSKKDKMTIYNAMLRNILRPGTALILLEAQAATGFIIDPINNKKLSVDEAVGVGIFGTELHKKLLSAEKAVTGYTDPYTGDKISLFQAMQKDLIVKDHGIRLLEAQIATGGIIDPVHSHRVPVEVAYKRGYFDEEMNQVLSDPTDDTKGFFDPNTHENLTYLQLLSRCIQDPDTGLYMLEMKVKKALPTGKTLEASLKSQNIQVKSGRFKDRSISIWVLLHSEYFTEEKRQMLLKQYKSGTITIEELITTIVNTIEEWEQKTTGQVVNGSSAMQLKQEVSHIKSESLEKTNVKLQEQKVSETKEKIMTSEEIDGALSLSNKVVKTFTDEDLHKTLNIFTIHVKKEEFESRRVSLWEILHSKYISEEQRNTQLNKYQIALEKVKQTIIKLIEGSETKSDKDIQQELEDELTLITAGEFKGQNLSLWFLLHSKYLTEEKREELLQKYRSGASTIEELLKIIITIIEETEKSHSLKFKGFRRQVTATELLHSEIIDQTTLNELTQGNKTVEEVTQMDNVKRYLEGTSCIAGVFVTSKKDPSQSQKMTIYDAMLKQILRPGTALVLLEAQAATGYVIDPINNEKLSVDEALSAGLIGYEIYDKLLSAERGVTGYKDPYTGGKISLFQAMKKDLIVKDHGIRLLEAQIATGGIIDPIHSHRVPVEVAYKRGYFDEEMNQVLSDPTDDTKGFFDPNTHENLTYLQLLSRCIQDPDTGLYMLEMKVKKALPTGKTLEASMKSQNIQVKSGRFKDRSISIWVLLHSEYFTEEKRQILLKQYKSGTITIEELITTIMKTVEEWEQKTSQVMNGSSTIQLEQKEKLESRLKSEFVEVIKGKFQKQKISMWELLYSDYITENKRKEILQNYSSGVWNLEQIIRILTVIITETEENFLSIEKTETDGTFSTPQLHENMSSTNDDLCKALNAITINFTAGEFQEQNPSLWKVLHSKYLSEDKRKEQLSKHQVTVEKVKETILQLIEDSELESEEEIQKDMELKFTEVSSGEFKGQHVSVWFLLHSKYITEEKRQELIEKYRAGALTMEELLKTIITIIEETEKSHSLKFKGFRRQVTATELLKSEIIDQNTLNELTQGSKTVEEVTQMDTVKRYLEGTSCIAGVFVTSKKDPSQREKTTIYDAMLKQILRPGTALVLLEAQAATGYVIDPIKNKKLSVDEAFSANLIGYDIYDKLLSAERGVTGYKDPYTGGKISLFQAMKKDLIVKDHGIRLLEAQIATGGIIDPIHSHRVPVEVAYKRGYFDEEMNQILSDPTDDTKGFFDPNTHENLTYLQLLQRCVKDQETGLYMLDVKDGKQSIQVEQTIKSVLKSRTIRVDVSVFKGKEISVWDLLYSQYISVGKREELLKRYRAGTLTIEELITIMTAIIAETDKTSVSSSEGSSVKQQLQSVTVEIFKGSLQEESISLWDLLHSKYIAEDKRKELLEKFKSGTLTIEEIINIILSMIHKTEHTSSKTEVIVKEEVNVTSVPVTADHWPSKDQLQNALEVIPSDLSEKASQQERRKTLQSTMTQISKGHFRGQTLSVWDLLYSNYITPEKREDILLLYSAGKLTTENIIKMVITVIEETEERAKHLQFRGLRKQVSAMELLSSEIIDQRTLNELAQGSKTLEEVTKMDNVKRYLEGTSCIAGVFVPSKKDPAKKEKMSIYQAMWKQLLRPGTALVLLEAQAATGFIIDPINNKKLSVDEAVSAGVVGKELHAKLLSAERAVTGYNDPYTTGKISLFQAMKKNLIVKDHGIRLLEAQIATGGIIDPVHSHRVPVEVAYKRGYFDEEMNEILSDPSDDTKGFFDPNTHANLTYLQLLQSCIQDPDTGLCMLEVKDSKSPLYQLDQAKQNILQKQMVELKIQQYQGQRFSLWELLSSHHFVEIEKERRGLLAKYKAGTITLENLTTSTVSLIQQMEMKRSTDALERATTSSSVHESEVEQAKKRVQIQNFLQSVDISVKGHKSSLWELLNSSYISSEKKNELLAGYESGELSLENLTKCITEIFITAEKADPEVSIPCTVTISPEKTDTDIVTTLTDLVHNKVPSDHSNTATSLKSIKVPVVIGEFMLEGKTQSLWDLLHSKYVTEDKRRELLEKYESKSISWEEMFKIITTLIEETEEKGRNIKFNGLRKQVSASELLKSEIIDQDTLFELTRGTKTLQEVTQMNTVKRYLEGTNCIAGVLVQPKTDPTKKEKMSIYDAMLKRILRPGTALVLLEAQAATGFIIDPIKNSKLTVDEAVAARVFGKELHSKLLSAERAVTGYNDPTTNQKISLFQAMQKDLIVKDHGIRLLEAQIATGGIIDPVHSHRVPVEVAYKRSYFDEEMNHILSDPSDDTKGFFDPNTHENLTYLQLVQRAVQDPDTGLLMLEVIKK
ncbi:hypothetical protein GDO78_016614 [Eleutherodactylus coqui]|uniref:Epiplakin n=1 Tax=Eleutherodactylus coqui TaxID=57060 RepID=A0A8J6EK60_ELECQ|nr:hypothetical protein GDO78_016614 [Eleutherodactylus coqui]